MNIKNAFNRIVFGAAVLASLATPACQGLGLMPGNGNPTIAGGNGVWVQRPVGLNRAQLAEANVTLATQQMVNDQLRICVAQAQEWRESTNYQTQDAIRTVGDFSEGRSETVGRAAQLAGVALSVWQGLRGASQSFDSAAFNNQVMSCMQQNGLNLVRMQP